MITIDELLTIGKENLTETAKSLDSSDLLILVDLLSEKDDKIRYQAFQVLQNRSIYNDDVYPFWDTFRRKLKNENSYQRSIGLMLIAENVKWDLNNQINDTIFDCFEILKDEKPITVRQCIQSLHKIVIQKPELCAIIAERLMSVDLSKIKETMRKSILTDLLHVLSVIHLTQSTTEIENYFLNALTGEILDKKTKKQFKAILNT